MLRDHTGKEPGPDMVMSLRALTDAQVDGLVDAMLALDHAPTSHHADNEVWPLVNARVSTFTAGGSNQWYTGTAGPAGLNLVAAIDPRFTGTGRFPDGVLRALLYCHGLVIEDPLALAAELYAGTPATTRALARNAVEAAVASLVEISPLLDAGVIDTFFTSTTKQIAAAPLRDLLLAAIDDPDSGLSVDAIWDAFEAGFVDGLHPRLRDLWQHVRGGDRTPPLDLVEAAAKDDVVMVETLIRVLSDLRPCGVVENAVDVVAYAMADIVRYGGSFDLLCPSRLFAELAFATTRDAAAAVRLSQIADVEIPGIADLLVEDAVRIRQESDAFDTWRRHLSEGLDRARALRAELGPKVDVADVVADVLADARQARFQEVRRSPWLARHSAMIGFVAGALGGAIGGAASGLSGLLVGGIGGVVPAVVGEAVRSATGPPPYLRRHYLLFERRAQ